MLGIHLLQRQEYATVSGSQRFFHTDCLGLNERIKNDFVLRIRIRNTNMALHLEQGTQIFRSVSNKKFIATYLQTDKGMRIEVDPTQQPVDWGKHPTVFTTLSPWAMLCSTIVLGNGSKHSASGWHVCYIKAKDKRIYLHKLREEQQKAKPEPKEMEEMPPKKPFPKELVPLS